jgi:hypothetical protein
MSSELPQEFRHLVDSYGHLNNLYASHGLAETASKEAIEHVHAGLRWTFHTDRAATKDSADREALEERFKEVERDFAVLLDEDKRRAYDAELLKEKEQAEEHARRDKKLRDQAKAAAADTAGRARYHDAFGRENGSTTGTKTGTRHRGAPGTQPKSPPRSPPPTSPPPSPPTQAPRPSRAFPQVPIGTLIFWILAFSGIVWAASGLKSCTDRYEKQQRKEEQAARADQLRVERLRREFPAKLDRANNYLYRAMQAEVTAWQRAVTLGYYDVCNRNGDLAGLEREAHRLTRAVRSATRHWHHLPSRSRDDPFHGSNNLQTARSEAKHWLHSSRGQRSDFLKHPNSKALRTCPMWGIGGAAV